MSKAVLETKNVTVFFGGVRALYNVSVEIFEGEMVGIVGPNGAGKSTLFNVMVGLVEPWEGSVLFFGEDITPFPTHERVRKGITKTSQKVQVFPEMTVWENAMIGAMFWTKSIPEASDYSLGILEYFGLANQRRKPARELTLAQRALLELCRSLCTRPRLVLLDELVAGLNAQEMLLVAEKVQEFSRKNRVNFMITEHNVGFVREICTKIYVLDLGSVVAKGKPEDVFSQKEVIRAYLGGVL